MRNSKRKKIGYLFAYEMIKFKAIAAATDDEICK